MNGAPSPTEQKEARCICKAIQKHADTVEQYQAMTPRAIYKKVSSPKELYFWFLVLCKDEPIYKP